MWRRVLRPVLRPRHQLRIEGDALTSHRGALPTGWVLIDFSVGGDLVTPARLQIDRGAGFSESDAVALPLARRGKIAALIRLPAKVRGLSIALPSGSTAGALRIREIGSLETLIRLGAPVVRRRLASPEEVPKAARKLFDLLLRHGPRAVFDRLLQKQQHETPQARYHEWIAEYERIDPPAIAARIRAIHDPPLFSVLMPVRDPDERWLRRAIESVQAQLWPRWELCIADDGSQAPHVRRVLEAAARDPRIKVKFRPEPGHISAATNSALALATGDFVALLDHDDELAPHALYMVAEELRTRPDADLVYSDEDKLDDRGRRFEPFFKPDWNPELLLSQNYVAHLCVVRRSLVSRLGGFRRGFEGSQDHDLVLRIAAASRPERIRHVPHVLYHWRSTNQSTARRASAKGYAAEAGRRAVEEHTGVPVSFGPVPGSYRVRWPVPAPAPLVSVIIPTRDRHELLERCISTLLAKSGYPAIELIVVDNQSSERVTLDYLSRVPARVLRYDAPFNFPAINNLAAREARGELLAFLNNDLEILKSGWLEEMVAHAIRPGVGAVGARLLYPDRTVQHDGIILGIGGVAGHSHKYLPAEAAGYFGRAQLTQTLSAVTAACLVVRRTTFGEVHGFDEQLPVAYNDVDFCLRLRAAGYRNVWTPFATLIHHESKSRGGEDTRDKRARFRRETELMQERWGRALLEDPAYSPNLTLESENFAIAWPPRTRAPWR